MSLMSRNGKHPPSKTIDKPQENQRRTKVSAKASEANGRAAPQETITDVRLERMVLGASMRNPEQFPLLSRILGDADVFSTFPHQCVWRGLTKMSADGLPIEAVGLAVMLEKMSLNADVPDAYLIDLWETAPSLDVRHHAQELRDLFLKRLWIQSMDNLRVNVYDKSSSAGAVIEEAKRELDRLAGLCFAPAEEPISSDERRYMPFPVDALPASLQEWVLAAAEALGCEPAFVAVPALVVVGGAIGNSHVAAIKETWQEPSVIWAAVVADSSSMKSPAMDKAVAPLWSIQLELAKKHEWEIGNWTKTMDQFKESRSNRFGTPAGEPQERPPEKPVQRKLVVSDCTIEKLGELSYQNPQGICLLRDELSAWFASFSRYSDGKGPGGDLSQWLQLFRASPLQIERKTGDLRSLYIPRAACSVFGTIQPGVLTRVLSADTFECGLVARLLLCMPPRKAKGWTEAVIPDHINDTYSNNIKEIYLNGSTVLTRAGGGPRQVGFTKSGKSTWIDFYQEWARKQQDADGEQNAALAKLEAYCARFALLLACYEKQENPSRKEQMTENDVLRSYSLVQWFAGEQERIYSMVRGPAEKAAREKVVEFIRSLGGEITVRRLQRSNESRYPSKDAAARVLEDLVAKNLAQRTSIESEEGRGRPTTAYRLTD